MKIILILWVLLSSLWANCTQPQISQAQTLYTQAEQSKSKKEQINLLYKALSFCYSAEIEANYLILKAESANEVEDRIGNYKDALIAISKFQDRALLLKNQDRINLILSKLYKPIDKEVARVYRSKVRGGSKSDKSVFFAYTTILFLFFLWTIFYFFKK